MKALLQRLTEIALRYRRVTSSGTYVPQIDGLRFLAIMPVMFWHSGIRAARMTHAGSPEAALYWLPHGYVGVEFFFFISGYIIAYPFIAGRPPSLSQFYIRRIYRLEPPYILAMCGAFAALQFSGYHPVDAASFSPDISLSASLLASLVYLHGAIFRTVSTLNPPAWSLEVEIQFYLLSPFLLAAYLAVPSPSRRRISALAVALALLLLSSALDVTYGRWGLHRLTLLGHAAPFILGVVVCDQAVSDRLLERSPRALADLGLLIGVPLLLATGLFELRAEYWIGIPRDLLKLLAMWLIYMGAVRGPLGRRWLGAAPIALIGGMCYSIYLTHVPVMQVANIILRKISVDGNLPLACALCFGTLIPLAILCGFLFYLFIERPCMERNWPSKLAIRIASFGRTPRASGRGD
jgi:peptidoglycan/LPS O-acetylase OafA/YrhL